MGLDLKLLPIRDRLGGAGGYPAAWLGHSRLDLDRQYAVFAQIPGCHDRGPEYERKPVAESRKLDHFTTVGTCIGDEYEHVQEDAYGTPLEYMLAGDLGKVNVSKASPWNQACFAFIKALPPRTPVVLWWC